MPVTLRKTGNSQAEAEKGVAGEGREAGQLHWANGGDMCGCEGFVAES